MEDALKVYVDRILEISTQGKSDELTEKELKDIARDLGLTEQDLQEIDQRVNDSVERAIGFMERRLWDNAVSEWEEAMIFAPDRTTFQARLAMSLAHRAERGDRDRAQSLANKVLIKDPSNQTAYDVLAHLQSKPKTSSGGGSANVIMIVAGLAILGLATAGVMAATVLGTVDESTSPIETFTSPISEAIDPPEKIDHSNPRFDVEVKTPDGLLVDVFRSKYDHYGDKAFFKFAGWVTNESPGTEFTELTGKLVLELVDGTTKTETVDVHSDHEAPIRPGDKHVFEKLVQLPSSPLASATLEVSVLQKSGAPSTYADSKPIDLQWGNGIDPNRHKLRVLERSESIGSPSVIGRFHKASWEFHNDGQTIKTLKVRIDYRTKSGKSVENREFLVSYSSVPPIEPNTVRIDNTIQNVKSEEFDHYTMTIIEIE